MIVCKIPLLARALGLKAARPSARATIGYLVYNRNDFISGSLKSNHSLIFTTSHVFTVPIDQLVYNRYSIVMVKLQACAWPMA